ncbi:kinase-like protein [Xylaria intraflava]|nr:kinase-like protein [Xylaria intraflava]
MANKVQDEASQTWEYKAVPIMDDVEELGGYRPGGFAPVTIGDTLANRYQIVQKLGNGGNGIAWLCWDLTTQKWKAVKINSASDSSEDCGDLKALKLMKDKNVTQMQLDANHIMMASESFWEESANGRHLCTVMPVLGPRANIWRAEALMQDAERVKKMCYQITKGLSFLHKNGLCHGDFRPQNVLMKLKPGSLDDLTKDDMAKLLGEPKRADLLPKSGKRTKHAPKYVIEAVPWERFREFVSDDAVIVDFGQSYTPDDPPLNFGIPLRYAAPEVLFRKDRADLAGDIWSLGITLLELRLDDYANNAILPVIRNMERFVGMLPIGYRYAAKRLLLNDGWKELDRDADGKPDRSGRRKPLTGPVDVPIYEDEERDFSSAIFSDGLTMKLASEQLVWSEVKDPADPTGQARVRVPVTYFLPDEEVQELADLVRRMLKYNSKERISASKALRHKWFKNQRPAWPIGHRRYNWAAGFLLMSILRGA